MAGRVGSLVVAIVLLLSACRSSPTPTRVPSIQVNGTPVPVINTKVLPILGSTELSPGSNRFVFALIDAKSQAPVANIPQVDVLFFKVQADSTGKQTAQTQAVYRGEGLPLGVFVTRAEFSEAGAWGALLILRPQNEPAFAVQLPFDVVATSRVPRIGQPALPSKNLVRADVADLAAIDSARPSDDMHELTIADAVRSGKPTLILFATPGFCETATCGPDLQVVQALKRKYGDRANFIHIETPSNDSAPQAQKPTTEQWGLTTEPWVFLIDRQGVVADRFEGGITLVEIEPALVRLLD